MKKRILAVGSSNIDFVGRMPRVPQPGETLISNDSYAFVPGGKGANSAVAAARLGADVVFCTRVGNDGYAFQLHDKYKAEGIDTRFVFRDKTAKTGLAVVMVEQTGHNRIVVYPGANALLSKADIEEAFTCYPDALLIQLETDFDSVVCATEMAHKQGAKVFLDAGPARSDYPYYSLAPLEVFSPNETETEIITGIRPTGAESCLRAAISICSMIRTKYVVIKLGERGCFVYDGTHCRHIAPVEIGIAVDTTAAGDAFMAALTHRYLNNGEDIFEACEYANGVGAYVVTKPGAFPSLPTEKQLREFLISKNAVE